jgi:hypothetical protein
LRCCCSYRRRLHRHPILRRRRQSIASGALWYVCRSEKLRRAIWSTRWTAATFRLLRASITNRSLSRRLSLPSRRRISKNGRCRASSSGSLQLPFSPMRVFAPRIERPYDVAVQSPHDADARHHGRAVMFDDQEYRFDRSLSCCSAFGSFWIYLAVSSRVTSWRPRGSGIGSSNVRFQPGQPSRCGLIRGDAVESTH